MTNLLNKSIIAAISFLFIVAFSPAQATENPFGMSAVDADQVHVAEKGKCGEGKCGGEKKGKCGEGKCGGEKKGKCGEGKCGDGKDKKKGKCGEGKCGGEKKGKCGEGKCGGKG